MNVKDIKEKERNFREKDRPFEEFTVATKTKWWSLIELNQVCASIQSANGINLLDIGCSDGRLLEYLYKKNPQNNLYGIDFAHNPLKALQQKTMESYPVCGDISSLPYKDQSFQYAVAIQVIQQIPTRNERQKVLRDIHRVLAMNGRFILTVLNQKIWAHLVENGKEGPLKTARDLHVYLYNPEDLRSEMNAAGFSVERIVGINHLPVRHIKKLKGLSLFADRLINIIWPTFSLKKGCYLLAVCQKK
ncbi:MAG: class I SAM-dependent methyltransferase [Candidatus Omnitrophica bacterium]|nr:class I SAM-dependent methyltransferase [Candidatus Omnitrophota bacterium]